jgi:Carboxypeptidase regulatory-like domain
MKRSLIIGILAVLVCALFFAGPGWGQTGASTIRGTVKDPSDALVSDATVTLTNIETNAVRTTRTSTAGTFSFEILPVGDYELKIEAKGFRKLVMRPVQALVANVTDVPATLELGEMSATVTVEAVAANVQVNTSDATLGNNFNSMQLTQLPIEGRGILPLLTLQAQVTPDGYVAGGRSDQSNVTLDGVDINDAQTSDVTKPVLRLNSEAIEEFRVVTVNANADEGRSSAAQINLVTKSGTNSWHGSAFEFHRNTIFTANDFFNNRDGVERPKLLRNVFGGTFGGPIKKDKLFFFYSYEGRRDASGTAVTSLVPLAGLGQGQLIVNAQRCTKATVVGASDTCEAAQDFTLTTPQLNNAWSVVHTNPVSIAALNTAATKYPGNDDSFGDGIMTSGYRFNASTPVNLNSNMARIDWTMNSKMNAFFRLNTYYDLDTTTVLPAFPDTPAPSMWAHPWGLIASHNWTIRQNWVNSFRYGLTRQSFSQQGDSNENAITFRSVFSPTNFNRTTSRTTPVHNIVDDVAWIKGKHTINFGTNIRLVKNNRVGFSNAYDSASTNYFFYSPAGTAVTDPLESYMGDPANNILPTNANQYVQIASNQNGVDAAGGALIGRYSSYSARFTFAADGSLLPSGTPTNRTFATNAYDFYVQDSWKIRRNLTLNVGLRYGIASPVSETNGYGVVTDISTEDFLNRRIASAATGVPYTQPLSLDLAGGNGKGSLYNWDKNNFQPRISLAWSPNTSGDGFWRKLMGQNGKSVIRTGFAMTNDYYGEALATAFDLNNTLGYTSNVAISANTFNLTTNPGPLFTGFDQDIRSLAPPPGITYPTSVSFPRQQPSDFSRRIESGIDTALQAPVNYQFSLTYEREMKGGLLFQASYVGRLARHLLATRDVMALNDLKDPKSGMDWYTAATMLEKQRQLGTDPANIKPIPYFENILPAGYAATTAGNGYGCTSTFTSGCLPAGASNTQAVYSEAFEFWANDWTDVQDEIENYAGQTLGQANPVPYFFNPQYGALSAWGTIANSNYHGFSASLRQRFHDLQWDFNYTYSHSLDNASGLQTSTTYGGAFILNAIRPNDNYANSDFDLRHIINANAIYQLPFGRGKRFGSNMSRGLDAVVGGWQLSGIYRWNTGLPNGQPYDTGQWATNWEVQSNATQVVPIKTCPTRGDANNPPKLFGCNTVAAYQSYRSAYPGETGQRNILRAPGYVALDMGLSKVIMMPWSEKQQLALRWEVFNVTNTQHLTGADANNSNLSVDPDAALNNVQPPPDWSNFTRIQGTPRVMQIGIRFSF